MKCIEKAVQSTKRLLDKYDVRRVPDRGIYNAVSVWAGCGTFDTEKEVQDFQRRAKGD